MPHENCFILNNNKKYNQYLTEEHFDSELKECPSFVGK